MLHELLIKYIIDPNDPAHNYNLALYYESIDQTASAVSFFLRCAEKTSSHLLQYECLIKAASCFEKQGKRNFTVRGLFQHAISILPERPEAYYLLSRFYEREDEDGSWQNSYMIASIGEKLANKNPTPLQNPVDYPGFYAITFQKAVAAWWCGLCEESRNIFIDLNKNKDSMEIDFKTAIENNINNLCIKEPSMNSVDKKFDWGNLHEEYIELFSKENFVDKIYERHKQVKTNDIVFDIGANYGSFTYSILDKKPKAVYCIEPSNTIIDFLIKNVSHGPVTCINKAISDKEQIQTIPETGVYIQDHQGTLYSTTTFRKIIEDYNIVKIDFLKFDCEGGEYSIFTKDNYEFIKNNVTHCAGEWHINNHHNSVEKFIKFRDLYLKDCSDLHVYERNGKDITVDIFNDQYLYDFREFWKNTYLGQFIIYFSLESAKTDNQKTNIYYSDSSPEEEWGLITTNKFKIKPKSDNRFFVVDNFYEDPDAIRNFAIEQTYFPGEGAVGHRTRKQFLFDGIKERFEQIMQKKIVDHTDDGYGWKDIGINGRFQYCPAGTNLVYHCDSQQWAALIYLTPDAPVCGGTSFYRHKQTKKHHNSQIDWNNGEGNIVFNQNTFLDRTPYELVDTVGNIYNRLVIFDGGLIHSASEYFGWNIHNSRLFQIFFFNAN